VCSIGSRRERAVDASKGAPECSEAVASIAVRTPLFRFKIFQPDPASFSEAVASLFNKTQKSRVVFETVFAFSAVACDDVTCPAVTGAALP